MTDFKVNLFEEWNSKLEVIDSPFGFNLESKINIWKYFEEKTQLLCQFFNNKSSSSLLSSPSLPNLPSPSSSQYSKEENRIKIGIEKKIPLENEIQIENEKENGEMGEKVMGILLEVYSFLGREVIENQNKEKQINLLKREIERNDEED